MTAMRSQYSAARPRSWVMKSVAIWRSRARPVMRSITLAWVVTSRPVVGSSAISSAGRQASAMAIITRWHMPPESSKG